jgi:hypothetical protein
LVEADERVQEQEHGLEGLEGGGQALAVRPEVEPQARGSDDVQGKTGQGDVSGGGNAVEALAHQAERVFGGKEQHRAGATDRKAAQAGGARGDRQCDIQSQE